MPARITGAIWRQPSQREQCAPRAMRQIPNDILPFVIPAQAGTTMWVCNVIERRMRQIQ
jgi:hypothetical protein